MKLYSEKPTLENGLIKEIVEGCHINKETNQWLLVFDCSYHQADYLPVMKLKCPKCGRQVKMRQLKAEAKREFYHMRCRYGKKHSPKWWVRQIVEENGFGFGNRWVCECKECLRVIIGVGNTKRAAIADFIKRNHLEDDPNVCWWVDHREA